MINEKSVSFLFIFHESKLIFCAPTWNDVNHWAQTKCRFFRLLLLFFCYLLAWRVHNLIAVITTCSVKIVCEEINANGEWPNHDGRCVCVCVCIARMKFCFILFYQSENTLRAFANKSKNIKLHLLFERRHVMNWYFAISRKKQQQIQQ